MADLSQLQLNGTTYNLKDATARGLLNGHSVNKDVPANAVFTDTTYNNATINSAGLMSAEDKQVMEDMKTNSDLFLVLDIPEFSSLPITINNSLITENHYVLETRVGNAMAQGDTWTITTSNGSLTITGTAKAATTMRIVLGKVVSGSTMIVPVTVPSFTSLPQTVHNSQISSKHVVLEATPGTPEAQVGEWTVDTYDGYFVISGVVDGSIGTSLDIVFGLRGNT